MLYQIREWQKNFLQPLTKMAEQFAALASNPANPWSYTSLGQHAYAGFELLYRLGKDYEKPAFGIDSVIINKKTVAINETLRDIKPFCHLREFIRDVPPEVKKNSPTVLVCAPLSGHHATLLRDTVRSLLQDHNVLITDWVDARMVPVSEGAFGLNDYVSYIQDYIRLLGPNIHVLAVCQPTAPVLAAISLMASNDETLPRSLAVMGGPIDPRQSPTEVNDLANQRPFSWFENNVIKTVPSKYPGYLRKVYPGFLQHAGFIAMNPNRHLSAHGDYYQFLIQGSDEDANAYRKFYDEYNAVLDLPAEFYLETIKTIFQEHALPKGTWHIDGQRVAPESIKNMGLFTVEGELDDITGPGQTHAALTLCSGITAKETEQYTVQGAGHYGVFSGRRWRELVYPKVRDFIARFEQKNQTKKTAPVAAKPKVTLTTVEVKSAPVKAAVKSASATKAKTNKTVKKPTKVSTKVTRQKK